MFSGYFNFNPTIEESGSFYIIKGIETKGFLLDLKNHFGTSVIGTRIVNRINSRTFKIHKFFAVELTWILDLFVNERDNKTYRGYRVGLNKYTALYKELKEKTWVSSTFNTYKPYDLTPITKKFSFIPFDSQKEFLLNYAGIKQGFQLKGCLLDAKAGSGKAQSLDSLLKTPGGWKRMGDIKVGDKVIGQNGKPITVVAIHPQGLKQLYKVKFADGRYTECCAEHLWTVRNSSTGIFTTEATSRLIERMKSNPKDFRIAIPLIDKYDGEIKNSDLPIEPYVLGALLGDGCFRSSRLGFSTSDSFIVNKLNEIIDNYGLIIKKCSYGDYDYSIVINENNDDKRWNGLITLLKQSNLWNKLSHEKFIPKEYLESSYENRLKLLQGLMDTDGTVGTKGGVQHSTSSEQLNKDIVYLIRSLGGIAKVHVKKPFYTHNGERREGKLNYVTSIRFKDPTICFTLPRQLERLSPDYQYKNGFYLRVVSIEESRVAEAQCITVDSPDNLYVTDDFIVTHNSFLSLAWSEMISPYKTIILSPKKLVNVPWVDHIDPSGKRYCFKNPPKYWTSLDKTNPLDHQDAEYFIFYSVNIRKDNWQGVKIDSIINTLSKNGKEPLKLIIDECHNYNDLKSQQTQGLIELGSHKYISDVLFMSGTPIKALGKETYPMFVVLDKFFDRYVRDDFLKMYGRDNYYLNMMLAHRLGRLKYTIKSIDGMGDAPVPVTKKIKFPGVENFTLKAIRAEMLKYIQERIVYYNKMMPEYIYDFNKYLEQYRGRNIDDKTTIENLDKYIKIVERFRKHGYSTFTDNEYSKFCKEVESDIESYLKGNDLSYFRHIKTAVKYVGLKIRGEALGNVLGRARIEAVKATIEHCGLNELINGVKKKTIIYSAYVDALDYTDDYLRNNGWDTIKLTGSNSSEIDNLIKLLETDPNKNPLITTFKMLSEGYPLLMCNQIIVLNSPWRSYQLEQTIHRIFRKGQDTECFVWLIDLDTGTEDNVTSRNIDIMEWSAQIVDQLLNGGKHSEYINGVSLKVNVVNDNIDEIIPIELFNLQYRPKFANRSILDLIR